MIVHRFVYQEVLWVPLEEREAEEICDNFLWESMIKISVGSP